jgi:hypothetical protein
MILPAAPFSHRREAFADPSQPFVGFVFSLLKNSCASKTTRVLSATFALVAFFAAQEFPMKPNFVNAILLALLPTGRGADARACTKHDDRLPGERNRYAHI